jgi:putative SOS response-associated peptidase YedK
MCGRYLLTAPPEEVADVLGYLGGEWFPPRYNIAPTQPVAIVRTEPGGRGLALVRWGLVPSWVEDPEAFSLLINARAESAAEKPAFRAAMQYRRCLVPATGFYEWRRGQRGKGTPFWIRPRGGGVIAFAGLWETWHHANGSEIDTGCVLTTASSGAVAEIHDRMPVVIAPADFDRWLNARSPVEVQDLLRPPPKDLFEAVPVSDRVNRADTDGPGVLEPPAEPELPF